MNQEVFKVSLFSLSTLIVLGVVLVIYFQQGLSFPLIVVIVIWILILIGSSVRKVTIDNEILSYRGLFKRKEISLREVAHIAIRIEVSTDSDQNQSSKKVIYVLDELGRTHFSFPGGLITRKNQRDLLRLLLLLIRILRLVNDFLFSA